MTQIQHFSDTIHVNQDDPSQHDTTVDRLRFYYETLAWELGVKIDGIDFIPSQYGNSFQTAAQAINFLKGLESPETQVVLINNAARAKHSNSWNAKGSYPLWAQVTINGTIHHIIWVDDEAFELIECFHTPGTTLQRIISVHYNTFQIPDTSAGSQFRSKDYFPLIQLLFLKQLQETWCITPESLRNFFEIWNYELERNKNTFRTRLLEQIGEKRENLPCLEKVIETFLARTQEVLDTPKYQKTYIHPWFEGIEKIQIAGEFCRIYEDLWVDIFKNESTLDFIKAHRKILQHYFYARAQLSSNELLLIDRDKFGNCIFAPTLWVNSLDDWLQLDYSLWEHLSLEYSGWELNAILAKSISDQTGKVCLWQSSSTGPTWERFFNINRSFSPENSDAVWELQTLPIGSVIRCKGKLPLKLQIIEVSA